MDKIIAWWQSLPQNIDPVAFKAGSFPVHWYSLAYLAGFATVYFLLMWRIGKKEGEFGKKIISDALFVCLVGLIAGGRLGYVFFYNAGYYLKNPLEIILPFQFADGGMIFTGIYGMSYFGGLLGIIASGLFFARTRKINFWKLADFTVPAVPAGYFFGRLGNFLNGELYGRVTEKSWGMYFFDGGQILLRHPSQLYEAFFEGIILFSILWCLRNKALFSGQLMALYLAGYGAFRFMIEFWREPDAQPGFILLEFTLDQIFCLLAILSAAIIYVKRRRHSI